MLYTVQYMYIMETVDKANKQPNGDKNMSTYQEAENKAMSILIDNFTNAKQELNYHYETCSNKMLNKLIEAKEEAAKNLNSDEEKGKLMRSLIN